MSLHKLGSYTELRGSGDLSAAASSIMLLLCFSLSIVGEAMPDYWHAPVFADLALCHKTSFTQGHVEVISLALFRIAQRKPKPV